MPRPPQPPSASESDERKLLSKYFGSFQGVFTQSARTAIPDQNFFNLVNAIPIGAENCQVVPSPSAALCNYGADTIYWSQGLNLNGTEYLVNFGASGAVYLYNIAAQTSAQINSGTLLSGAGSRCVQWQNTQILFIDATGYYNYDGTTFSQITGSGVPTSGNAIAVYASRVWIAQGRVLYCSGAGDYSAAAWTAANGAAATSLTDPTIRSTVTQLIAANGYLYIFSVTGISAISDVQVPSGASPPTPVFTLQNLQALIGSDQAASVIPYDRNVLFASRYGFHTLIGVDAPKMSSNIDGTWQYVDFATAISAGQVVVENILCGAFLINRLNDPIFGSGPVIALWYSQSSTSTLTGTEETTDIWWFGSFGAVTFVVTGMVENTPALFAFVGNALYQLFANDSVGPHVEVWSKLWPMEDELAKKQVIQAGFEADFSTLGEDVNLYVDTATTSLPVPVVFAYNWINAAGVQGQWLNAHGVLGYWSNAALNLFSGIAPPAHDRHVGLRLVSDGAIFQLHLLAMDYKLENRWMP